MSLHLHPEAVQLYRNGKRILHSTRLYSCLKAKQGRKKIPGNCADFSPNTKKWTFLPFTGRRVYSLCSSKGRRMKTSGLSKEHFFRCLSLSDTCPYCTYTQTHTHHTRAHVHTHTHIFYFIEKHSGNNQRQLINVIFRKA